MSVKKRLLNPVFNIPVSPQLSESQDIKGWTDSRTLYDERMLH